ncbi:MAG: aspartate aminotransferase [Candidatus Marinimicrobia bacterium]|nr:aspartate aminotransferase [Candidatus Neomarinimicrobiota bacterium]
MTIANRVNNINPSFTLQMVTKAAELKSKGVDVINFSVGEPDFNTPKHIREAAKNAIDQGYTKYTAGPGMIELREAICTKLKRENGISYQPSDVLVSNGEKQSLYTACQAIFNPNDNVVIFSPYWVSFPEFVKMADAKPILVNTLSENNFEPDFSDLESKLNPDIKGVIINTPSNPTGGVWSKVAIVKLLKVAKKNDWVVISDECYERLIYDGEFVSAEKLNQLNNIGATVVTCMSLSKTYAMTGWRIGYAVGPNKIIKAMSKIQGQATSCANSIGQKAGIAALLGSQSCVQEMKKSFLNRRDLILKLLNELPGVKCAKPSGAFYVFPDFSAYLNRIANNKLLKDTFDISEYILDSVQVVTVPGDGFGVTGHIRFSYATNRKIIKEGMIRLKKALNMIEE